MGFLGSIKKSPLFRMAKRKRPEPLSLAATTCDFSQDTSLMEIDDPEDTDTQELLSPKERIESFDERPIMVSDEEEDMDSRLRRDSSRSRFFHDNNDTVDANIVTRDQQDDECVLEIQENEDNLQEDDALREEMHEDDMDMVQEDRYYVSSDDEADAEDETQLIQREVPPRRTHVRIRSDGQLMHIFHDELATLYEEPNKSDSSETETGSLKTLDESNIRARWDYALQLMVGHCDASLYNTIAEMIPGVMEAAEI
jgi:hypothetical protein